MASQSTLTSSTVSGHAVSPIPATTQVAIGQLPTMQQLPSLRDPEWLKLEVCREFQRGACNRTSDECKYAHPGKNIQVMPDGKVIACFDALKGRCTRESCKYVHPPGHLKQQLEINGRNNLIQQRAMLQMMPQTIMQPPQQMQVSSAQPMLSSLQQAAPASHMYTPAGAVASSPAYTILPTGEIALTNSPLFYYPSNAIPTTTHPMTLATSGQMTAIASPLNPMSRADRLDVCRDYQRGNCTRGEHECRYAHPMERFMIDLSDNTVTVCMDCIKGRCIRDKCKYFHPPAHLQAKIRATQHPGAYVPTHPGASPGLNIAHPAVMANNNATNALGQPPQKRHALESKIMTQPGAMGASLTHSLNGAHAHALYGYGMPLQQQAAHAHAYYQVPLQLSMYGGATTSSLPSAPSPLTAVSLPTVNGQTAASNATAFALLNGQSQDSGWEWDRNIICTQQSTSSLTVCRDFQSGKCSRPYCRFVHVTEDFVEVRDDKVTVCKDFLNGKCSRVQCKFYHPSAEPQYVAPTYHNVPQFIQPEALTPPAPLNSPGIVSSMPPAFYAQPTHVIADLQVSQ